MYNRAAATVAINGTLYYKKWPELKQKVVRNNIGKSA